MKTLLILLSAFFAMSLTAAAQNGTKPSKEVAQKTIYACPMHPKEMSMKEGNCSKCGMKMVKTTEKIDTHATKGSQPKTKMVTQYVCSMDSTTSDKPGKCAKCGMEMVKTTEKIDTHATKGSQPKTKMATQYVCSMDSTTSDKPGNCSKCGMPLTKVAGDEKEENHKH